VLLTQLLKTAKTSNPKATLESLALEAFKAGKTIRLGSRKISNLVELLSLPNLEYIEIEEGAHVAVPGSRHWSSGGLPSLRY
jgi:hypothetical protein